MITVARIALPGMAHSARVLTLFGAVDPSVCDLGPEGVIVETGPALTAWRQLFDTPRHWDVVILGEDAQRFYDTSSEDDLRLFFAWLIDRSEMAIIPAKKVFLDAKRTDIGPWEAPAGLAHENFVSELPTNRDASSPPLLVLSRSWLWTGKRWLDARSIRAAKSGSSARVAVTKPYGRTYLGGNGEVVKIELCRADYFDDSEVIREVDVLTSAWAKAIPGIFLPCVMDHHRGDVLTVMVREAVDGVVLTEFLEVNPLSAQEVASATVSLAKSLARHGVFHNDFRPWNLLWDSGEVKAVDFSRMSEEENDARSLPNILALAGTLSWISQCGGTSQQVRLFEHFDGDIVSALSPHLDRQGVSFSDLYDQQWRDFGTSNYPVTITCGMSLENITEQLVPPARDRAEA
jgi:hypothetical protein